MKLAIGILAFLNLALGAWIYTHGAERVHAPRPVHPELLRIVGTPTAAPPRPPIRPAPAPPAPQPPASPAPVPATRPLKKAVFERATLAARGVCVRLGPLASPAAALRLLQRLKLPGRWVEGPGSPAYRLYLPIGRPWPPAARLAAAGVRGAYVTHGPSGGEVLSLGVFVERSAARRERLILRAHGIDPSLAAFGAPGPFYAEIRSAIPRVAFGKRLGAVGPHRCPAPQG